MELEESVIKLQDLVVQLRQECPWDQKQTHESLKRHLIEEAYETVEAIDDISVEADKGDAKSEKSSVRYAALKDELGDLLYQVFFHSLIASEAGQFTIENVVENISDKLYRRHPHVFGDLKIENEEELAPVWEEIKKAEKDTDSAMDKLPKYLPALLLATKIQKKAKALGLFPEKDEKGAEKNTDKGTEKNAEKTENTEKNNPLKKLMKAQNEKLEAVKEMNQAEQEEILGELLWGLVSFSSELNIDAEDALRKTSLKFAEEVREKETGN